MENIGDLYSLEDPDCIQLFITQETSDKVGNFSYNDMDLDDNMLMGLDVGDFKSPCVSSLDTEKDVTKYSDISDDDDFVCSQVQTSQSK